MLKKPVTETKPMNFEQEMEKEAKKDGKRWLFA